MTTHSYISSLPFAFISETKIVNEAEYKLAADGRFKTDDAYPKGLVCLVFK